MTKKRKTRDQKVKEGGAISSRYAEKITARKRAARKVGLRINATWPEIWAAQEEDENDN